MATAEDGELPDLEFIEHKEVRPHGQVTGSLLMSTAEDGGAGETETATGRAHGPEGQKGGRKIEAGGAGKNPGGE